MTRDEQLASLRNRAAKIEAQFRGIDVGSLFTQSKKESSVTNDIFHGGPMGYDETLDATTVAGKERRERGEKSLQEYQASRAKYYEDHPDEIDIDAVVERYYDRMFQQVYG